jgi:transposase
MQPNEARPGSECPYSSECGQIRELSGRVKELDEANKDLGNRLAEAEAKVEKLKGMLRRQVNDRFNRSSEKSIYINPGAQTPIETAQSSSESEPLKDEPKSPPEGTKSAPEGINQTSSQKKRKATPHGRVIPEIIPVVEQIIEIPESESNCSICGTGYRRTTMYEESSEIDIQIKVVRNHIKRVKYAKKCKCEAPEIITAEKPPNIIYKSLYSTSLWVLFLMFKYCLQIPLYRQTGKIWNRDGAEFKNSTIIGGFKKLHAVLIPLYEAMIEKSKTEKHWHADETSWKVFIDKQGKKTFNWWMWVFASATVVVYILDRTRSASVPEKHLGGSSGILNVDRYAAYKVLSSMLLLALCWYHVRRDFIKAAVSFPQLCDWTQRWLEMISELEEINDTRVEAFVNDKPEFAASQALLESKVESFFDRCQEQLNDPVLTEAQHKILKSLIKNKEGLTVFVDNPLVPMHNNPAERTLRPLAVARNNFYGSHAPWSGELAAICMSIYMTAHLHNINPEAYIEYYFNVCAKNESKPPANLDHLLIWNLTDEVIDSHNLRNVKKIAS